MGTIVQTHVFSLNPYRSAQMQAGGQGLIMGSAILSSGSAQVPVPFGGSSVIAAVVTPQAAMADSDNLQIYCPLTIAASGTVTFTCSGSSGASAAFSYMIAGYMDEA